MTNRSKSAKKSSTKGKIKEREFANLIGGKRIIGSGAFGERSDDLEGDVRGPDGMLYEVKARAGKGSDRIEAAMQVFYDILGPADAVAMKFDRAPWIVVRIERVEKGQEFPQGGGC